jgi:hypothetical protein
LSALRYARREKPFLALNCAAISPNLVEATLFGYASGAFTGAIATKAGYFEDAADGTLFLDEIGELALELQAKLLRVLENGEYQRVGETQPRVSRARIIAATNRDLRKEVRAGNFRADLYHRLSVCAIVAPPLARDGRRQAAPARALPATVRGANAAAAVQSLRRGKTCGSTTLFPATSASCATSSSVWPPSTRGRCRRAALEAELDVPDEPLAAATAIATAAVRRPTARPSSRRHAALAATRALQSRWLARCHRARLHRGRAEAGAWQCQSGGTPARHPSHDALQPHGIVGAGT